MLACVVPLLLSSPQLSAQGVIRLGGAQASANSDPAPAEGSFGVARSGFDYRAFEGRLESLWFQRKTFLANGRTEDAARQADSLVAFIQEEGIKRLPQLSGALIAESRRFIKQGEYDNAQASLALAERVDPGRAQIHLAKAHLAWVGGGGIVEAIKQVGQALSTGVVQSARSLSLVNQLALILVVAVAGTLFLFSLTMLWRYQRVFRHELSDFLTYHISAPVSRAIAWVVLMLPLLVWVAAGWAAYFWILLTFRYMRRSERVAAIALLVVAILLAPGYNMAVALYSMTADPQVRTTIASAEREYDPNRILKLRRLVEASPEDPVYHFLLAGVYKSGRYYEEAFDEYRACLKLDADMYQAHLNIGNIFYITGQYNDAVTSYNRTLEIQPRSALAHFNMHLAQSESFRFSDADAALKMARQIDSDSVATFMTQTDENGGRPRAQDATLMITSVWDAALKGRMPRQGLNQSEPVVQASLFGQLFNPVGWVSLLTLFACLGIAWQTNLEWLTRQCIRCGDAFKPRRGRKKQDANEYCTQCHHLFILGEGLAPGAKQQKLYEIQRRDRRQHISSRILSAILPGSCRIMSGKAASGLFVLGIWLAGWIAFRPDLLAAIEPYLGLDLRMDLLSSHTVPAAYRFNAVATMGLAAAAMAWIFANLSRSRRA